MESHRLWVFIFVLLFVLFLAALIIVVILSFQTTTDPITINGRIIDNRIGASSTGFFQSNNGNNILDSPSCRAVGGTWQLFRCTCPDHKFGDFCNRDVYTNEFKAIGITSTLDDILNPKVDVNADNLSFGEGVSCTDLCEEGCAGVFWDGENCKLITGNSIVVNPEVDISQNIPVPYSFSKDSNIYGKLSVNNGDLDFTQRLVLYNGKLPWRYWLNIGSFTSRTVEMFTMIRGTLYNMSIHPQNSLGTLFGVFTENNLNTDPDFLKTVIESGFPGYVVIRPNEPIPTIPWQMYQGISVGENGK